MTQTRRASLLEAVTQSAVALPIGFAVAFVVGFMGLDPLVQAFTIAATMFVVSTVRGYLVRRRFERFASSIGSIDRARLERLADQAREPSEQWSAIVQTTLKNRGAHAKACLDQAREDAVTYDHFDPLTSTNWEPPPFAREPNFGTPEKDWKVADFWKEPPKHERMPIERVPTWQEMRGILKEDKHER
jgi:hypothetical protein